MLKKTLSFIRNNIFFQGSTDSVLEGLYSPWKKPHDEYYFKNPIEFKQDVSLSKDSFPVPPPELRMGYGEESDNVYLEKGSITYQKLKKIIEKHNIPLDNDSSIMEWGCATGRVMRYFHDIASKEKVEFWGVDQSDISITWAKENLSVFFNFLTCTSFPYLPFKDEKFSLIYGISVFTHIDNLIDMWLVEFNRILSRGGYCIFTIHDENSIKHYIERGKPPFWMPKNVSLNQILNNEIFVVKQKKWDSTFTYFHTNYIKRQWSQYFEITEIIPFAEGAQSAVVLKKIS